jgi:REP element-mobilizing transposase RayT
LNDYGKIVENYWLQIPNHYKGVHLDEFVIMPNHIHGIILIVKENKGVVESVGVEQCSTPTDSDFATLESSATSNGHSYGLLSKIIKPFKDVTVKHIHRLGDYDFSWQRSFHDHIVRSEFALQRIRQYILDNPLKWNEDENNPKNFIMKHK